MDEEKLIPAIAMIYVAMLLASMLKLKKVSPKNILLSALMPLIVLVFAIDFVIFRWCNEFSKFNLGRKILRLLKLVVFEIKCLPQIHTTIITAIKPLTKHNSKNFSFQNVRDELNPLLEIQ